MASGKLSARKDKGIWQGLLAPSHKLERTERREVKGARPEITSKEAGGKKREAHHKSSEAGSKKPTYKWRLFNNLRETTVFLFVLKCCPFL